MGFLDKAKKMAEQAQAKLDEAQKQFNTGQGGDRPTSPEGPVVEYDEHGRPVPQASRETASPPQGDPLAGSPSQVSAAGPVADPQAPPAPSAAPAAPPLDRPGPPPGPGEPEDRNHPSYAPPKLTSGDPLAG